MKYVKSPDLRKEYDVIVAGAGPAGLGAAIAAAREGAAVLLVEKNAFPGGVAVLGLGMQINHVVIDGKPRGGVAGDFVQKIQSYSPQGQDQVLTIGEYPYKVKPPIPTGFIVCNVEYLTMAAFELLEEAGVDYLLHSFVHQAITDGNVLQGVRLASKSGDLSLRARVVVDATGDADVAALSGAAYKKGRQADGFLSPATLLFTAGGVDFAKMRAYQEGDFQFMQVLKEGAAAGYCVPERLSPDLRPDQNIVYFNGSGTKGFGNFDGTNVCDLTAAERLSRQQAIEVMELFRKKVPGFESAFLVQVAPSVSVRETRRIVGEYTLTDEDIEQGTEFPSVIARRFGELDVGFVLLDPMVSPHDVPYGCLLPKHVENLLVAGRCISASHLAHSAGKSMGNCFETGQAAGTAAAIAASRNIFPRELAVATLQRRLTESGVVLGLERFLKE